MPAPTPPLPALLVIDDDPVAAALIVHVAMECGYAVSVTDTAPSTFRRELAPETVIVLDIVLPDEDGLQVMRRVAAEGCRNPIIVVSGYDGEYLRAATMFARALGLQVVAAIEKPFQPDQLRDALAGLGSTPTRAVARAA